MTPTQTPVPPTVAPPSKRPRSGPSLGSGRWLRWRQHAPTEAQIRSQLSDIRPLDRRRARWLVARAGYTLAALATLSPDERDQLRRNLSVSGLQPLLYVYYPLFALIVLTWAHEQIRHHRQDTAATIVAAVVLLSAIGGFFMLFWRWWLWATARWGQPDRELGLVVRRILVRHGELDRGAVSRLRGRRDVLLLARQVPGLLMRGESDGHFAAALQADLREGADPRPVCRDLLLRHLRGDLLEPRITVVRDRPDSLASTIPRWLSQLATMAPAVLLILGVVGVQID